MVTTPLFRSIDSVFSTLLRCFRLLNQPEKTVVIRIAIVHSFLNLLDLFAVLSVGYLGSRALNYSTNAADKNSVSIMLSNFPYLKNLQLSEAQAIKFLGLLVLFLFISKTCFSIFLTKKLYFFLGNSGARISKHLVSIMLQNTYSFSNKKTNQENLYSFTSGVNLITTQILPTVFLLTSDAVLILLLTGCILISDTTMALFSIGFLLILVFLMYLLMHSKAERVGTLKYRFGIESQNQLLNLFSLQQEIKAANNSSVYVERFEALRKKFSKAEAQLNFYPYLNKYVIEISLVLLTLLAITFQLGDVNSSDGIGPFLIFFAVLARILPAILRAQQNVVLLKSNFSFVNPTISLANQLQHLNSYNQFSEVSQKSSNEFTPFVRIANVSAFYEENHEFSIQNLSLEINPGSVVALVGPSGSGKSTLANLILGSKQPSSGDIMISGFHPSSVHKFWPGAVAFVPQDVFIMNASIRENISLSDTVDEEKFNLAIKASNLSHFLDLFEKGADTVLQEKGSNLSGGEKQRIGIARALYYNPKLLILDEATSSLDSENESLIMNSILSLKGKVTLIIIAHRLSTVVNADQVVYLRDGKIISKGSFDTVRTEVLDFDHQAGLLGL